MEDVQIVVFYHVVVRSHVGLSPPVHVRIHSIADAGEDRWFWNENLVCEVVEVVIRLFEVDEIEFVIG